MTTFDVVLVPFPFSDLSATKQRPCLVLAETRPPRLPPLYVVAMLTSNLRGTRFPHDVVLSDWQAASLPKPTLARLSKLVSIERPVIRRQLGRLGSADQASVRQTFGELFRRLFQQGS